MGGGEDLDLSQGTQETDDVIIALKSLGYTKEEAKQALQNNKESNLTTSEKIKQALKYLGK